MISDRRDNLRERCREKKIDGFLAFDFFDTAYLSGFPQEGCFLLSSLDGDFMFAPQLLADQAESFVDKKLKVVRDKKLLASLEKIIKKNHIKKLGFDSSKVTVALLKELESMKGVAWVGIAGFVLHQRMVKDAEEINQISKACHITFDACQVTFNALRVGQTEKEVAHYLEEAFFKGGGDKIAFETIIAFHENAGYPHHVVTNKKLKTNMAVLMDCGTTVGGYKSDLTRTGVFGKISSRFRKIFGLVSQAQKLGISTVREGVTAGEVDNACRQFIAKAGYGDYFIHGTGHGVGLEIHEPPRLGPNSKEVLKEGMIVTVEPGIYLPGEFGVRIEDTLLVKKNGYEVLTK